MMPVNHPAVPPLLAAAFVANPAPANPTNAWNGFGGKTEITIALDPVQRGICPFCEVSLKTWGCHIDHLEPKSINHGGTFRFDNLVLCCIHSSQLAKTNLDGTSCGHFRGNTFDPILFILPTEANCSNFFSCKQNGELQPAAGLSQAERDRADYMIRELNFNCRRLKRRRRDWILAIQKDMVEIGSDPAMQRWYLQDCLSHGKPFLTVIQEYFGWI